MCSMRPFAPINSSTFKLVVVKFYVFLVLLGTVRGEAFFLQSRFKRHGTLGSSVTNATSDVDNQINNLVHDRTQNPAALKPFDKGSKLQGDFRHSSSLHRNWPQSDSCYRSAKCEPLLESTCFGVELPYAQTSIQLVNDSTSQLEIQERMNLWQGLEQIPRCWAVVQPLLCAYYRPRCQGDRVALPSQEMCRLARGFCKITAIGSEWPPFLRCEEDFFPSGCKNELREVKFNTSGRCSLPLVATPNQASWYQEVEGCGIGCQHPLLNEEELHSMRTFVVFVTTLAVIASLFAVLTFLIGWKEASQYPNVMVFYINLCLLFVCIGWLSQFVPGARAAITCRRDGTLRNGEPSSGEHLSCMVVFFLVYYFLMAALCWFVMLAYAWDHRFQSRGGPQREALGAKSAYFHLVAWSVPFVLTISVLALGEVDGDSVTGICFVSSRNPVVRSVFVLCPVTAAYLVGGYFLCRELYKLITLKSSNGGGGLNHRVRAKIQRMILRIGLFVLLMTVLVSCTFVCHVYEFRNLPVWQATLRDYIACQAKVLAAQAAIPESSPHCNVGTRPSLAMMQLHLAAFLGTCVGLSSWILTSATGSTWKRFWRSRILRRPSSEPAKMQKHKLIAEAFARRNELNRGQGSLHSAHDDPVGMNLDLNSVTSQDLSSTWAAALPGFLHRRGAVAGPSVLPIRRHSSTSDVSRQVSMNMRRQSLDSQLSYQVTAEQQWIAAQRAIARNQRRKTRRERERLLQRQSPFPLPLRRGSDSSIQSAALHGSARRAPMAVAKSTSTGDLNPGSVLSEKPPFRPRVVGAQQKNGTLINPPFTHGMSDQSRLRDSSVPAVGAQSADTVLASSSNGLPAVETSRKNFPPAMPPFGAVPNPYAPYMGMPYGYAPFYPGFPYFPPGMYPYGQAFTSYPDHTPLIPLHPMPDSMSETSFIPIITSDSEYTDVGIRSHDEAQLEAARRIVEERTRMVSQPGSRPQTNQETQTEVTVAESPRGELNSMRPYVKSPVEAIEMREIGSGQSRRSNRSSTSRARVSPMSRVSNPPQLSTLPSAAASHVQNRADHQPRSPSQCVPQNLSVPCHLEPVAFCSPQTVDNGNHWQQHCCTGCSCGPDHLSHGASEGPYRNGYLQGQQVLNPYYTEHHISSTDPADSCPSHSDGVQSCHTYVFAPATSPTHSHCPHHDAAPNSGFYNSGEQHHAYGCNGCAVAALPCEANSAGHIGSSHNPQDATGFVSR